uniref:Uncharacterized protein n=1 Tax=Peronospora matthiolae TaxID=2874970 RepID=A0AAV1U800_9STRA
MGLEPIVEELYGAITGLISAAHRANPVLPTHSAYIKNKLLLYDIQAALRYFAKQGIGLSACQMIVEDGHKDQRVFEHVMPERAREDLRAIYMRIFESEEAKKKLRTFKLDPDEVFTMMVDAGERPGVEGDHFTTTSASPSLEKLDTFIKKYSSRHQTKYTMLGTLRTGIDDPDAPVSFVLIAISDSVRGDPAERVQQKLFEEWQCDEGIPVE